MLNELGHHVNRNISSSPLMDLANSTAKVITWHGKCDTPKRATSRHKEWRHPATSTWGKWKFKMNCIDVAVHGAVKPAIVGVRRLESLDIWCLAKIAVLWRSRSIIISNLCPIKFEHRGTPSPLLMQVSSISHLYNITTLKYSRSNW